jgi:hypothetical protein
LNVGATVGTKPHPAHQNRKGAPTNKIDSDQGKITCLEVLKIKMYFLDNTKATKESFRKSQSTVK